MGMKFLGFFPLGERDSEEKQHDTTQCVQTSKQRNWPSGYSVHLPALEAGFSIWEIEFGCLLGQKGAQKLWFKVLRVAFTCLPTRGVEFSGYRGPLGLWGGWPQGFCLKIFQEPEHEMGSIVIEKRHQGPKLGADFWCSGLGPPDWSPGSARAGPTVEVQTSSTFSAREGNGIFWECFLWNIWANKNEENKGRTTKANLKQRRPCCVVCLFEGLWTLSLHRLYHKTWAWKPRRKNATQLLPHSKRAFICSKNKRRKGKKRKKERKRQPQPIDLTGINDTEVLLFFLSRSQTDYLCLRRRRLFVQQGLLRLDGGFDPFRIRVFVCKQSLSEEAAYNAASLRLVLWEIAR